MRKFRKKKRIFAFLLTLVLTISLFGSTAAFAGNEDESAETGDARTETVSEDDEEAEESAAESESEASDAAAEESTGAALSVMSAEEEEEIPYTFVDSNGTDISGSGITQTEGAVTVDGETVTYTTLTISASGSFTLTGDMDYYDIVLNPSSGDEDEITVDLDLNGHTITGSGTTTVIIVKSGATLNFKDSTASESSNVSLNQVASLASSFVKSGNDTDNENLIWAIVKNENNNATTYTTYYATITSVDDGGSASYAWSSYTSGAVTGGGVNTTTYVDGGGIRVENGGILNMSGGTICLNEVEGDGGGISIGNDINWTETVRTACSITGGMISGNRAGTDNVDGGGGLYFECYTASVISNLALVGNYAYYGGGLSFNMSYGDEISDLTIVGNSAYAAGGMHSMYMSEIETITNIVLENNEAEISGGGAGLQDCNIGKMSDVTVRKNTAGTYGGGFCLKNYYRNANYEENVAIGELCDIEVSWNKAGTFAGGVYILMCDVESMSGITVSENEAGTYAGGMMVYNSTVSSISGVSVSENEAGTFGGGLVIEESGEISISGLEVTENAAEGSGGGIVVSGNTAVTISDSTVSNNTAGASGGGLYVGHLRSTSAETTSGVTVCGTVLANNLADESADDVYCAAGNTLVLNSIAEGLNADTIYEADGKELLIDGWYNDTSDARYYKDGTYVYDLNTSDTFDNSSVTAEVAEDWYLVAAHSPYVLIYDGNEQSGGTVENVPADSNTYDPDETAALNYETIPTHSDVDGKSVVFAGWSLTETDEIYDADDDVAGLIIDSVTFADSDITVYAVWQYAAEETEESEEEDTEEPEEEDTEEPDEEEETGESESDTASSESSDGDSATAVVTGDSTNAALWFTILIAAVVCLLIGRKRFVK